MRTFIAIELPEEIKSALSILQEEINQSQADVKWVHPHNIHLTLKFLGEIEEKLVTDISLIIRAVTKNNAPFPLSLSVLGAFPHLDFPRIIWIGIKNEERVIKIAEKLEEKLQEIGIKKEARAFSAHLTLGRLRSAVNRKILTEKLFALNKTLAIENLTFQVSSITLFKSSLTPQGPIYKTIFSSLF